MREILIGFAGPQVPVYLDYKIQAGRWIHGNTPPTFAIYMADLVFKWMEELGGVPAMEERNPAKAKLLYDFIDNSELYTATVLNPQHRSIMNVTYVLEDRGADQQFGGGRRQARACKPLGDTVA